MLTPGSLHEAGDNAILEQAGLSTAVENARARVTTRVAHITTVHPAFDIRIYWKECMSLASHGYDVTLVVPYSREETLGGVRIVPIRKAAARFARITVSGFRAFLAARRVQARIWHLHDPELLLWAPLARLFGVKVIYDMHENLHLAVLTKDYLPELGRKALAKLTKVSERVLAGGVAVVFAEHSYVQYHPWARQYRVVLNMPLLDRVTTISEAKYADPTIVYIGGVSEVRGSLVTLEALHVLMRQGLRVAWECIGAAQPEHARTLADRAVELGVRDQVRIRGPLKPPDAWKLAARCHIGLAVLAPIPNYIASYPTKMFEYMGLGLPVVASDFLLYREVLVDEDCGLCVPPGSAHAVAEAIRTLVLQPDRARQMGQKGKVMVERKYNWRREEAKLLSLYADVLRV